MLNRHRRGSVDSLNRCDGLILVAQLREDVALQLDLLRLVDEEAIDAWAGNCLMGSDVVLLTGHREATSRFPVVDIVS